jgi:hypothetical protein
VDRRRDGGLVLETADNRQLLLKRRQRLKNGSEFEGRPLGHRRPLIHDGAMRQVHEPHARLGARRGLSQRRPGRDHRIQQREADGDTRAAKEGAPREMLLGDEHHWLLTWLKA